jgi:hypothetical protein
VVTIYLTNPDLDNRARELLTRGGECNDWELLTELAYRVHEEHLDVRFVRKEKSGEVVIKPETMLAAVEMGLEMRPVDNVKPVRRKAEDDS